MEEIYIQSRQNNQVKNLVKLRERKHRDRQSLFLVEGLREVTHALGAGYRFETLYFCPELFSSTDHPEFIDQLRRDNTIQLARLSKDAFEKTNFREGPDGVLAVVHQVSHSLTDLSLPENPLILVLEGIEKPGNLGAILRSTDGAGADAVILVDCILDLYNPNAIRSSQGLSLVLPIADTSAAVLDRWLIERSVQRVATTPEAEALHWDVNYTGPTAFFMGSESAGLSTAQLAKATTKIRIPMSGRADSLNVAAATAVCLYEARRQRSAAS